LCRTLSASRRASYPDAERLDVSADIDAARGSASLTLGRVYRKRLEGERVDACADIDASGESARNDR
jgi:hypothetical protein